MEALVKLGIDWKLLLAPLEQPTVAGEIVVTNPGARPEIGRASCRERVCPYV